MTARADLLGALCFISYQSLAYLALDSKQKSTERLKGLCHEMNTFF
jgi:hypothetical protein